MPALPPYDTAGGVASRFTIAFADAVLPARSTAVPTMFCANPSCVTITGSGHDATPERSSAHVKVTVTGPLFHPVASAPGAADALIVGGVVSPSNQCERIASGDSTLG